MESAESMGFFVGNVEGYTALYEEGKAKLESRHNANEAIYKAESGIPDFGDLASDVLTSTLKKQGQNFIDMGKGMIM